MTTLKIRIKNHRKCNTSWLIKNFLRHLKTLFCFIATCQKKYHMKCFEHKSDDAVRTHRNDIICDLLFFFCHFMADFVRRKHTKLVMHPLFHLYYHGVNNFNWKIRKLLSIKDKLNFSNLNSYF